MEISGDFWYLSGCICGNLVEILSVFMVVYKNLWHFCQYLHIHGSFGGFYEGLACLVCMKQTLDSCIFVHMTWTNSAW